MLLLPGFASFAILPSLSYNPSLRANIPLIISGFMVVITLASKLEVFFRLATFKHKISGFDLIICRLDQTKAKACPHQGTITNRAFHILPQICTASA